MTTELVQLMRPLLFDLYKLNHSKEQKKMKIKSILLDAHSEKQIDTEELKCWLNEINK